MTQKDPAAPVTGSSAARPAAPDALPADPDSDVERGPAAHARAVTPRPVHLRASALATVFAGGTVGAGTRELLTLLFPPAGGFPWAVFGINLTGAFLLGFLLDALVRRGPDHGHRRTLRLLLGTGFMGGYTTYSSFATDTAGFFGAGTPAMGIVYGLATVLLGALASWAGIALATRIHHSRTRKDARATGVSETEESA